MSPALVSGPLSYVYICSRICYTSPVSITYYSIAMQSPLLDFALPVVLLYATWAVVLSDSRFHRVWSLALSLLLFLTTRLFNQPFSASSLPLAMLLLLVFIVCILLSPAQLLLFHTKPISAKRKALKIFNPENEVDHSVESVLPVP